MLTYRGLHLKKKRGELQSKSKYHRLIVLNEAKMKGIVIWNNYTFFHNIKLQIKYKADRPMIKTGQENLIYDAYSHNEIRVPEQGIR